MKTIKILGSGCAKCATTANFIQKIAREKHISVDVVKENNPEEFLKYGVMSTPAIVVGDQLVHMGSVPYREQVEMWLEPDNGA